MRPFDPVAAIRVFNEHALRFMVEVGMSCLLA